jgi:hypothetical protein
MDNSAADFNKALERAKAWDKQRRDEAQERVRAEAAILEELVPRLFDPIIIKQFSVTVMSDLVDKVNPSHSPIVSYVLVHPGNYQWQLDTDGHGNWTIHADEHTLIAEDDTLQNTIIAHYLAVGD